MQPLASAAWISLVMVLVMTSVGTFNRDIICRRPRVLGRVLATAPLVIAAAYGTMFVVSLLGRVEPPPHAVMLGGITACILAGLAVHGTAANVLAAEQFKRRLLVLGAGRKAEKVAAIVKGRNARFKLMGFVNVDHQKSGTLSPLLPASVLDAPERAAEYMAEHHVDEIVVATDDSGRVPLDVLLECRMRGMPVREFAAFCESEAGYIDLDELGAGWLVFSDGFRMNRGRQVVKYGFDLLIASVLLLLTLPITLPTALAIKMTSKGPILFRQARVGRNGKVFNVLKFRSMRADAETSGPRWAQVNDDRVTPVGRFIRRLRIDEIPQVVNVLRGDMSFIGPRPERPVFVEALNRAIPHFNERHRIKPGITGWAQINYPYGASIEDARHKLSYDLYYLKNGGIFLDLVILLQTVRVVLWSEGAR